MPLHVAPAAAPIWNIYKLITNSKQTCYTSPADAYSTLSSKLTAAYSMR